MFPLEKLGTVVLLGVGACRPMPPERPPPLDPTPPPMAAEPEADAGSAPPKAESASLRAK